MADINREIYRTESQKQNDLKQIRLCFLCKSKKQINNITKAEAIDLIKKLNPNLLFDERLFFPQNKSHIIHMMLYLDNIDGKDILEYTSFNKYEYHSWYNLLDMFVQERYKNRNLNEKQKDRYINIYEHKYGKSELADYFFQKVVLTPPELQ